MNLQHVDKPLRLFVYNADYDVTREAILVPNRSWGGEGLLGCGVGYGLLHRIPKPQERALPPPTAPPPQSSAFLASRQQAVAAAPHPAQVAAPQPRVQEKVPDQGYAFGAVQLEEQEEEEPVTYLQHPAALSDDPYSYDPYGPPPPGRTSLSQVRGEYDYGNGAFGSEGVEVVAVAEEEEPEVDYSKQVLPPLPPARRSSQPLPPLNAFQQYGGRGAAGIAPGDF